MYYKKLIRPLTFSTLAASALLLAACGGGSSSGSDYPTPTLPANAVEFNAANAETYATESVNNIGNADAELKSTQQSSSLISVTDLVRDQITGLQSTSIASGATETEEFPCDSGKVVITLDGNESSGEGSFTYSSCVFGPITTSGKIKFEGTSNNSTGAFTFEGGGTITISDSTDDTSITMVMYFTGSGNDIDEAFTDTFSFSLDGTGLPDGGFLVKTVAPLKGTGFTLESGEIRVYGGNNTQIKILVVAPNTAEVWVDDGTGGGFVLVNASFAM